MSSVPKTKLGWEWDVPALDHFLLFLISPYLLPLSSLEFRSILSHSQKCLTIVTIIPEWLDSKIFTRHRPQHVNSFRVDLIWSPLACLLLRLTLYLSPILIPVHARSYLEQTEIRRLPQRSLISISIVRPQDANSDFVLLQISRELLMWLVIIGKCSSNTLS